MRAHYDFSKEKCKRNPYYKLLTRPVTIRLDPHTIAYFKTVAEEMGISYRHLIHLYLRECVASGRRPQAKWSRSKRTVMRQ